MREGPIEPLTLTENTQPALMAVSLAVMRPLAGSREFGVPIEKAQLRRRPFARRILGAGAAGASDAGRYRPPAAPPRAAPCSAPCRWARGAMAALIGAEERRGACRGRGGGRRGGRRLHAANDNNAGNVVISGAAAVERAIEKAKERAAPRADPGQCLGAVPLPAHAAGRGRDGGGAGRGRDRPAAHLPGRQCHRAADQRSGGDPPPSGRAGHRPGALARESSSGWPARAASPASPNSAPARC